VVSGEAAKQLCTWAVGCVIAVGCATACCFCTSGFLWCQCPQSHFPGSDSKPNQTTINHTITTMLKGSHVGGWDSFAFSCSGPLLVCHKHSTINLHCDPAYLAGSVALLDLEVFKPFRASSSFNSNFPSTSGLLPIWISQQSCSHTAFASQQPGSAVRASPGLVLPSSWEFLCIIG
jgi:hypothetical protein